jgi:DNA-binding response OmpR family regulator
MKILIIEDEFILASELAETLESEGYEVVLTADNGQEASISMAIGTALKPSPD